MLKNIKNNMEIDINNLIKDYTENNFGINGICEKYHIGKLKVKKILNDNDIPLKKKGKQNLNKPYIIDDWRVEKYKRFHKMAFNKIKLSKEYGLPLTMTEKEMTKALGYDRIWDCGLFKFVWKRN